MKQLIKRYFPMAAAAYRSLKKAFRGNGENMQAIFSTIHQSNAWLGTESISGPGSDSINTATLKRELPIILRELSVRTLLDAPCGDLNWMKDVNIDLERYIGADIVPEVIHRNRESNDGLTVEFRILDITKNKLPRVDLIFCRDCLVHFSYDYIRSALRMFKASGSRYLLTTTFMGPRQNIDIETGGWRPLNLERPPFSLPPPIRVINEGYRGDGGIYADKSLGLWELCDLDVAAIASRMTEVEQQS